MRLDALTQQKADAMLFYSLFPKEKLCIFSAAGELTLDEMRLCHQELETEPDWACVQTIVADLRGCWNVDSTFADNHARRRMEYNAFGSRRMIWLTGSSNVLGLFTMEANAAAESPGETRVFRDMKEMARSLGPGDANIMQRLNDLE